MINKYLITVSDIDGEFEMGFVFYAKSPLEALEASKTVVNYDEAHNINIELRETDVDTTMLNI